MAPAVMSQPSVIASRRPFIHRWRGRRRGHPQLREGRRGHPQIRLPRQPAERFPDAGAKTGTPTNKTSPTTGRAVPVPDPGHDQIGRPGHPQFLIGVLVRHVHSEFQGFLTRVFGIPPPRPKTPRAGAILPFGPMAPAVIFSPVSTPAADPSSTAARAAPQARSSPARSRRRDANRCRRRRPVLPNARRHGR
jgi:hypothetical protein